MHENELQINCINSTKVKYKYESEMQTQLRL